MAAVSAFCRKFHKIADKRLSRTFVSRLVNYSSTEVSADVDEHLKQLETVKKRKEILHHRRAILKAVKTNPSIEKAVRNRELRIPLATVKKEWSEDKGLREIAFLAKYYGIFRDIFKGADFQSTVWVDVNFESVAAHRGNLLEPSKCLEKPNVAFDSSTHNYHSILLVNPDGCYPPADAEILHWMKINIEGNSTEQGEELTYLPPLPWKGSGFHRYCFAIFGHSERVDNTLIDKLKDERMKFQTAEFLEKMGDIWKPVGLSWFQAQWDKSVAATAQNTGIFEPIFEWEQFKSPREIMTDTKHKKINNKYRIKFTDDDILLAE